MFALNGFILYRHDHREHPEDIMVYVQNDLPKHEPCDLVVDSQDIKSGRVKSVVVEIIMNGIKWLLFNVYKKPTLTNVYFKT